MAKKNLPNIPLYIGDWERDCNVLDIASEGAWLRVVFKMWLKGKQSTIKIPTKSLQKLWRCSSEEVKEILEDIEFNEVAEIQRTEGFVEFTCRRFVKENELSNIRSNASKGNKKETKPKQISNKSEQNTDIDYDNDNAYDYLIKKEKEKIEIFEMQNKKSFPNYELFVSNFNNKAILEKLEFEPDVLLARLRLLNDNWDKKNNKKQLTVAEDATNR